MPTVQKPSTTAKIVQIIPCDERIGDFLALDYAGQIWLVNTRHTGFKLCGSDWELVDDARAEWEAQNGSGSA